jgi:predicted SAM-dependent methyltransferase
MFEENTVDEIMLIHVFEHLYTWEGILAVKEWYRIMKPGGVLTIEVPCMNKILELFAEKNRDPYMTFFGIFGEQAFEEKEMVHKWCYSKNQLMSVFKEAGFKNVEVSDPVYHKVRRDMRVTGEK